MTITTDRPARLAPWAFALSLALHVLLITPQMEFALPSIDDTPKIVNANLIVLPKAMPQPAAAKPLPQKKKISPPTPSAPPQTSDTTTETATATSPDAVIDSIIASDSTGATQAPPAETTPSSPVEQAQPTTVAEENTMPPEDTKPPVHSPVSVELKFDLYRGTNGLKIGRVLHTWQITNEGYVITSVAEASGIFAVIKRGQLAQTSQGRITAYGLAPDFYSDQRGQEPEKTFIAQFNWQTQTLTYGRTAETVTVPLPPQTQDQLSFVYQFSLLAPFSGIVQFAMTNGRKLGEYSYQTIGEEVIETELGPLKTIHISKIHQTGNDGVDVWLAADHQFLPVKIRLTDNDGEVVEQVIREIRGRENN